MLAAWERAFVEAALGITGHNLTQAARLLGVRRTTLYSRIQQFDRPVTSE
jgi:DNA-binding NtrC family response regulator